jgi:hypothetical protein
VFVCDITDKFILRLDILRAYEASLDVDSYVLRMGRKEFALWSPGSSPKSSRLNLLSDKVIPARCERVVTARVDATLEAANGIIELCFKA